MAVLPICTLPNPVLRQKAKRVNSIDKATLKLIEDMRETLHAAPGRAGLAAPQVGVSLRVIIIDVPGAEDLVLINPEIVKGSGERIVTEGCLSVPGYYGELTRSEQVTAKGKDADGKEIRVKGTELLAQALEHEVDHLNGILYIDHLESQQKLHRVEDETNQL
ncbi:MAG: peptide deformylase [Dehalococcoidia bacterium]|jgi:peptide deformylase